MASDAAAIPGVRRPSVVHASGDASTSDIGRYLNLIAPAQIALGWHTTIVGCDPDLLDPDIGLKGVSLVSCGTRHAIDDTIREIVANADVLHMHGPMAEDQLLRAVGTSGPRTITTHYAPVSTPSWRASLRRRSAPSPAVTLATSAAVASSLDRASTVLHRCASPREVGSHDRDVALMAQPLEQSNRTSVALRAWAASGLADRGWQLHIAGTGSSQRTLAVLAVDLGISHSVRFMGDIGGVEHLMATSAAFVTTAHTEPSDLRVMEAMSCGTAIVAANAGINAELLSDDTAVLIDPTDLAALASTLTRLAESPDLRQQLGRAAHDQHRRHHTVEAHVRALDAIYRPG